MKRINSLFLLLVTAFLTISVITACKTTPSQAGAETKDTLSSSQASIEIVNETGYTFYFIYVSSSESTEWGDDILDGKNLVNGESLTYVLPDPLSSIDTYDFLAEDEDGDPYYKWEITITNNVRIVFTLDDIYFED
jgi:hypothetical protein